MTTSNNIQAYVLSLGLQHRPDSMTSIKEILEVGDTMLRQYIDQGIIEVYQDDDTYFKVRILDYKQYIEKTKEYVINLNPRWVDKDKSVYYIPQPDGSRKAKPLISFVYTNPSNKVTDEKCIYTLIHLNQIKWEVWTPIHNYERKPKKPITDEMGREQYEAVTRWMNNAVSSLDCCQFTFGHYYDKRGRIYNDGFLVDYQGDEWSKAAIHPSIPKQRLTKRGLRAFQCDIANHLGLDKATYDERVNAVTSLSDLKSIKPKKNILFDKAVWFYNQIDSNNGETDYMCQIDATASCLQIQAIIANDSEVAKHTNLTDLTQCYDIYGEACKKILALTRSNLNVSDIRDIVKKAVMTAGYNSKKQISVAQKELAKLGVYINMAQLESIVYTGEKVRGVLQAINNLFSSVQTDMVQYTMPDGFVVQLPNITKASIRVVNPKYYYKYTMKYDERGYDFELNWRSLAPNIIHSK